MGNMDFWNKYKQVPPNRLKPIQAGRLKGKSDINPMWRYQALTEYFGPCGAGWKYTIDRTWSEPGANSEVFAFAQISLYVYDGTRWSDAILGIGGSKLCQKESGGMHSNDEGFKMAVTDAIGTACKMIGMAADVYLGLWDGSKYRDAPNTPKETKKPEPKQEGSEPWTAAQRGLLWSSCQGKGMSEAEAKEFIAKYIPNKDKAAASSLIEHFDQVFADYTGGI